MWNSTSMWNAWCEMPRTANYLEWIETETNLAIDPWEEIQTRNIKSFFLHFSAKAKLPTMPLVSYRSQGFKIVGWVLLSPTATGCAGSAVASGHGGALLLLLLLLLWPVLTGSLPRAVSNWSLPVFACGSPRASEGACAWVMALPMRKVSRVSSSGGLGLVRRDTVIRRSNQSG